MVNAVTNAKRVRTVVLNDHLLRITRINQELNVRAVRAGLHRQVRKNFSVRRVGVDERACRRRALPHHD